MKIETADTLVVLAGPMVSGLYKVALLFRERANRAKILLSFGLSRVRGQQEEQASTPPPLRNYLPKPLAELGPNLDPRAPTFTTHLTTVGRDSEADTGLSTDIYQDTTFPQLSRTVTPSRTGVGTSYQDTTFSQLSSSFEFAK